MQNYDECDQNAIKKAGFPKMPSKEAFLPEKYFQGHATKAPLKAL
ncbi:MULTISPECIES: hypothetical protein [Rhizobium/Agrobacterium group]|nr:MULTISPECIES: hypothetical protein [Rhizobium/Agrobacterium group]